MLAGSAGQAGVLGQATTIVVRSDCQHSSSLFLDSVDGSIAGDCPDGSPPTRPSRDAATQRPGATIAFVALLYVRAEP